MTLYRLEKIVLPMLVAVTALVLTVGLARPARAQGNPTRMRIAAPELTHGDCLNAPENTSLQGCAGTE